MEVLSQMIVQAVNEKRWSLVKASRTSPGISHIFFSDDLMLFGDASFAQARLMEHLLATFCGFSGQRITVVNLGCGSHSILRGTYVTPFVQNSIFVPLLILVCI